MINLNKNFDVFSVAVILYHSENDSLLEMWKQISNMSNLLRYIWNILQLLTQGSQTIHILHIMYQIEYQTNFLFFQPVCKVSMAPPTDATLRRHPKEAHSGCG